MARRARSSSCCSGSFIRRRSSCWAPSSRVPSRGATAPTPDAMSVVPFHLDAEPTPRVGADIALDLGVVQHLDLDDAAAGITGRALLGADIDAGRDIAAGLDRYRGRARRAASDPELGEAKSPSQTTEH